MAISDDDSLAYAKKKIELARLDPSEILPNIHSLTVSEDQEDLILLKLNPDIQKHLLEGHVLTIRGDPNDSAVICTDTTTYELKDAETSNSLLLMPDIKLPEECETGDMKVVPQKICGIFHNYLELRNYKPSFKKLKAVLEMNAYRGKEYEESSAKNYSIEDLLDFIQASREELQEALKNFQTCNIDGYIRILDFDYKFNILSQIIDIIESKSMPFNKFSKDSVVETLKDSIPSEILENCISWFAHETDETSDDGQKLYALDEYIVCRMFAEMLLRAAGKFHLSEFLESWQRSVPEGMNCDLSQLHGLALTDMNYSPEVIFHFPSDEMPDNIAERFTKLFKVKEKWTYDEIVPYLQDRALAGNDVKSLLIKYTRESTKNGVKMYSSKW